MIKVSRKDKSARVVRRGHKHRHSADDVDTQNAPVYTPDIGSLNINSLNIDPLNAGVYTTGNSSYPPQSQQTQSQQTSPQTSQISQVSGTSGVPGAPQRQGNGDFTSSYGMSQEVSPHAESAGADYSTGTFPPVSYQRSDIYYRENAPLPISPVEEVNVPTFMENSSEISNEEAGFVGESTSEGSLASTSGVGTSGVNAVKTSTSAIPASSIGVSHALTSSLSTTSATMTSSFGVNNSSVSNSGTINNAIGNAGGLGNSDDNPSTSTMRPITGNTSSSAVSSPLISGGATSISASSSASISAGSTSIGINANTAPMSAMTSSIGPIPATTPTIVGNKNSGMHSSFVNTGTANISVSMSTGNKTSSSHAIDGSSFSTTPMRLITAIIRPTRGQLVKDALAAAGVHGFSVSRAGGFGEQVGHKEIYRGAHYNVDMMERLRVEVIVAAADTAAVVSVIRAAARTGEVGDGMIWVTSCESVLRIRDGAENAAVV